MTNKSLEKLFQILAVIFIAVAAFFLWSENYDGVFVSAVLGCVSFFLSYRYQIKEKIDERDAERLEREFAEGNDGGSLFEAEFAENELADLELDNQEELPIER